MPADKAPNLSEIYLRCVADLGIDGTAKALEDALTRHSTLVNNHDARFVVSMVAKGFKIPEKEVVGGVGRKNERRYAVGFVTYYLHESFNYDIEDIAYMLAGPSKWTLYKHLDGLEKLNPKFEFEKKLLQMKKRFDEKVSEYISTIKHKKVS